MFAQKSCESKITKSIFHIRLSKAGGIVDLKSASIGSWQAKSGLLPCWYPPGGAKVSHCYNSRVEIKMQTYHLIC